MYGISRVWAYMYEIQNLYFYIVCAIVVVLAEMFGHIIIFVIFDAP